MNKITTIDSVPPLIISGKNITKIFPHDVWAIKKVNFQIYQNDVIAFVGPNGSGKSVLAKIIGNVIPQSSGLIDYYFQAQNLKEAIGYQAREQVWPAGFKVKDVLDLYLTAYNVTDHYWVAQLKAVFEIDSILNKDLSKLDIITLQLFAIFLILLYKPELIVIDELSSVVSFEKKMKILKLLTTEAQKNKRTVILIQPESFIIETFCNRLWVFNEGEIIEDLAVAKVIEKFGSPFEFICQLESFSKTNSQPQRLKYSFERILQQFQKQFQDCENQFKQILESQTVLASHFCADEKGKNILSELKQIEHYLTNFLTQKISQQGVDKLIQAFKINARKFDQNYQVYRRETRNLQILNVRQDFLKSLQEMKSFLENKLLPFLQNSEFLDDLEENEVLLTSDQARQLRALKHRYLREEWKLIKQENRRWRRQNSRHLAPVKEVKNH